VNQPLLLTDLPPSRTSELESQLPSLHIETREAGDLPSALETLPDVRAVIVSSTNPVVLRLVV
jgi:hypothetical protein